MAIIKKIIAREIIDSRATPTIEAIIELEGGAVGAFSVPSGLSIGKHEAVEIRDNDPKRFTGKGVLRALEHIYTNLAPLLIGKDSANQKELDQIMITADGTENKEKLGANSILALSGAIVKAQAVAQNMSLYSYIAALAETNNSAYKIPVPMFNILNGGAHGGGNIDFQEFMVVPPHSKSYTNNIKMGVEIYHTLHDVIASHSGITLVGDEGGFAPVLYSNIDGFKLLEDAISRAGYNLGLDVFFSIDAAASYFAKDGEYRIKDRPVSYSTSEFTDYYISLNDEFNLLSIEDPLEEDNWEAWKGLTAKIGKDTLVVGDDLITTNLTRLNKAVEAKACNAIIIKPNQVGTISETIDVVNEAKRQNFRTIVSHRSGETNDDFIADFAVGISADYVKFGAPARGERVAKYNRLLEIEHEIS